MGPTNEIREWKETVGPNPFKRTEGTGMRSVIGMQAPHRAQQDQMHVFAYGYGKDFAASSIVLCAKLCIWPGRSMQARLDHAFASFRSWCATTKHSTSLPGFDRKVFKMGQSLGLKELIRMEYSIKELIRIELAIECACCAIVLSRSWKAWPVGCGKAHDATLVARWLEKALEGIVVVSW